MSISDKFVSIAAKSPGLSITGPDVAFILTLSSFDIICASVVFPRPGGPQKRIWSRGSFLWFAALMNILRFALILFWPTNSAKDLGLKFKSNESSSLVYSGSSDWLRRKGLIILSFCFGESSLLVEIFEAFLVI